MVEIISHGETVRERAELATRIEASGTDRRRSRTRQHRDEAVVNWHAAIAALRDIGLLESAQADTLMRQDVPETPEIIRLNT